MFIGYNEYSREEFITDFLNNTKNSSGDLLSQRLGIEILYSAAKILYDKINNKIPIEEIELNGSI